MHHLFHYYEHTLATCATAERHFYEKENIRIVISKLVICQPYMFNNVNMFAELFYAVNQSYLAATSD